MATLVHVLDKQFRRYSATRNLGRYFRGVLHILGLKDDVSVHKAEVRPLNHASF